MRTHRNDPNLSLICGINSCPEEYTVYESFRSHVYRKHREVLCPRTNNDDENLDTDTLEMDDGYLEMDDGYLEMEDEDENTEEERENQNDRYIDIKN